MAWLEGAIRKEVTRHRTLRVGSRGVCLHIAVSNGASLFNYFNQSGNPTSHFYVRTSGNTDGMADFEQYVDTKYRAPANLEGNPTLISVESQGGVGSDLNNGWSPTMLKRLAWIVSECHRLEGIPIQIMPNSKPESKGVGWHKQGVDPYRVAGGEKWSTAYGKECPGDARIAQVPTIVNMAKQNASGGDDMSQQDVDQIKAYIDQKFSQTFGAGGTETGRYEQIINENRGQTATLVAATNAIIAWLNGNEVEDDFQEQLATARWSQATDEGRQQAASVLADAQTKFIASQEKIETGLAELALIKAQTAPPVEPPVDPPPVQ